MDLKASWPWPKVRTTVSPFEAAAWKVNWIASGPVRFVSASYVKPAPHSIISHLRASTLGVFSCLITPAALLDWPWELGTEE